MRRARLAILLFAAPLMAGATGATDPPSPRQVEREVARLSSDHWSDRRDAVDRLIRIGPSAEFPLRRLLNKSPGPEVRLRAEAALRQIAGMRRTTAALVTLELAGATPKQAFAQLAEIEGAELRTEPPDILDDVSAKIDARYQQQRYWEVVLDLCRRCGLKLMFPDQAVTLAGDASAKIPGSDSQSLASTGPFLFRAHLVPWSDRPDERGRSLRLEIYGEPRTEVLRGEWKVELEEALDERGNSLIPQAESGINLAGAQTRANGCAWTIPLRPASSPEVTLKSCKGKVKVVLALGEQTVELPGASGDRSLAGGLPLSFSSGWTTASVLRVLPADKDWEMDVQLAVDPTQLDFDALLASMQAGRFRTFDPDGCELALKNLWRDGGGPMNNIRCRWGSRPGERSTSAPFKLLWQVPTKTIVTTVPFELKAVGTH